jgi:hypothetical protein
MIPWTWNYVYHLMVIQEFVFVESAGCERRIPIVAFWLLLEHSAERNKH